MLGSNKAAVWEPEGGTRAIPTASKPKKRAWALTRLVGVDVEVMCCRCFRLCAGRERYYRCGKAGLADGTLSAQLNMTVNLPVH